MESPHLCAQGVSLLSIIELFGYSGIIVGKTAGVLVHGVLDFIDEC